MTPEYKNTVSYKKKVARFTESVSQLPSAFVKVVGPRLVLRAYMEEYITSHYEKNGPRSSHGALVGIGKILSDINEENTIDVEGYLKTAREMILKVYSSKEDRVSARIGKAMSEIPVEYTDKEYRTATESFVPAAFGNEVSDDQSALGDATIALYEKKYNLSKHFG